MKGILALVSTVIFGTIGSAMAGMIGQGPGPDANNPYHRADRHITKEAPKVNPLLLEQFGMLDKNNDNELDKQATDLMR
jgi:hypothetical protein